VTGLACGVLAAGPAAADPAITFDQPISGVVVNSCTGEPVAIEGKLHTKQSGSVTATGIKYQIEMNLAGVKGVTPAGARYVETTQSTDVSHAEFDPGGNVQQNLEMSDHLIRLGEDRSFVMGDDFYLKVLAHLTVNANGVPTVSRYDLRSDCR
jgi:hypothetical protein